MSRYHCQADKSDSTGIGSDLEWLIFIKGGLPQVQFIVFSCFLFAKCKNASFGVILVQTLHCAQVARYKWMFCTGAVPKLALFNAWWVREDGVTVD